MAMRKRQRPDVFGRAEKKKSRAETELADPDIADGGPEGAISDTHAGLLALLAELPETGEDITLS